MTSEVAVLGALGIATLALVLGFGLHFLMLRVIDAAANGEA